MRHITIKDVARQLNVSASTISRAFNDKYDIKKETRERILQVANEMGYHPNPIARKLIQQKTFNVGVVVPEFINSFFPEVIMGIQDVLIKENYQILIMQSNESYETELKNVKTLEENLVDGLIISLSMDTKNLDCYQNLLRKGYPMVFFNRTNDDLVASKVIFDDYKWSFFTTEHLINQGCKKIFHLSAYQHLNLAKKRINGYVAAMKKHGLTVDPEWIIETGLYVEEGERNMQSIIDDADIPDAIFCVNDMTALGAMRAIKRNGLRIPDDIAVAGFTETPFAELVDPPLTSVRQPAYEMGEIAANLLLKQIESEIPTPEKVILNGILNVRESSRKVS